MNKKKPRKLLLGRETLRLLRETDLVDVNAGATPPPTGSLNSIVRVFCGDTDRC